MKYLKLLSLSTFLASLLIGCGGGGGSGGSENDSNQNSSSNSNTTISGRAIDGYLKDAKVCLDLNRDGKCSSSEPQGKTDENGRFSLSVNSSADNFKKAPIVVYGGSDTDTGKPFKGKLSAINKGDSINVTPLTSLVQKVITKSLNDDENLTDDTIKKAEQKIKKILKLSDDSDINQNFVEGDKDLKKAALSLQKSIQTFAKAKDNDSKERDNVDNIFEAFALSVIKIDENSSNSDDFGLEKLIDVSLENNESKELLGDNAQKVSSVAKKIANKVEVAFDSMNDDSNTLARISSMIEKDLNTIEKKLENFDFSSNLENAFDEDELDLNVSEDDFSLDKLEESRIKAIKDELKFLKVAQDKIDTIVNELGDNYYVWQLYEKYTSYENNEVLKPVYEAIKKQNEIWQKEELIDSDDVIDMSNFEQIYLVNCNDSKNKNSSQNNNYICFTNQFTFSDGIEYTMEIFRNNRWDIVNEKVKNNTRLLKDGQWILDKNELVDKSISSSTYKLSVIEKEAISDQYEFKDMNRQIDMPNDAVMYTLKSEVINDSYLIELDKDFYPVKYSSNEEEYFTSFKDFIKTNCEIVSSVLHIDEDVSLVFSNSESCDTNSSSGAMSKVNIDTLEVIKENAGTWEIKNINGVEIMVVKDNEANKKSKIYTLYDHDNDTSTAKILVPGTFEKKGSIEIIYSYNRSAFDTIKYFISQNVVFEEDINEIHHIPSEIEEIEGLNTSLDISLPFSIYEEMGVYLTPSIELRVKKYVYKNDNNVSYEEEILRNNTWELNTTNYGVPFILKNGNWIKRENELVSKNNDGSISIGDSRKLTLVKEEDIEGKYIFRQLHKTYDVLQGAKKYFIKEENIKDRYEIDSPNHSYNFEYVNDNERRIIKDFSDLIQLKCENKRSIIRTQYFSDKILGLGFKDCDTDAKSGELVELQIDNTGQKNLTQDSLNWEVSDENGGTWEIKNIDGVEIMIIYPKDLSKYFYPNFKKYRIFTLHDVPQTTSKAIISGYLYPKDNISAAYIRYNEKYIESLKNIPINQ